MLPQCRRCDDGRALIGALSIANGRYEYDIHVPLIAAGDNLSFPIIGPFFRR